LDNNFYNKNYLKKDTLLNKKYIIEKVIGAGGFGVTYLAHLKNSIDSKYSIKEFLPINIAYRDPDYNYINVVEGRFQDFEKDRNLFRNEFENLEKIKSEYGIIPPVEYFEENKTNYIVTEFKKCITFSDYISMNKGKLNLEKALDIIFPLMDIVENIHSKFKMYHKDIRPENILIENNTNNVFLIDFGIAFQDIGNHSQNITVKISDGYSPLEQYKNESFSHGPWMDVYSIAATLYKALTGKRVSSVFDRIDISFPDYSKKILAMPSEKGIKIHTEIEEVLKIALEINYQKRFQSIKVFKEALITSIETTKNGVYDLAYLEYKKITKLNPPSILMRLLYKNAQMKDSKNDLLIKFEEFEHLKGKSYYEMQDLLFTAMSIDKENKIFTSTEDFKKILDIVNYNINDKIYKSAKHKYKKITGKELPTPLKRYYHIKETGHDILNLSNKYKLKKTTKYSLKRALNINTNERYKDIREYSANLKLSYYNYLINNINIFFKKQIKNKKLLISLFLALIISFVIIYYISNKTTSYENKIIFINTKPELTVKLQEIFSEIDSNIIVCSESEYKKIYENKTFKVVKMLDESDILEEKNKNIYYNVESTKCIENFIANKDSEISFIKTLTNDKIDVITSENIIAIPFAIEGFGMIYNKNNINSDLSTFKISMFKEYSNGITRENFLDDLKMLKDSSNPSITILPLDWLYGRHYISLGLIGDNKKSFINTYKDDKTQLEDYPTFYNLLSFYEEILNYNFLSDDIKYSDYNVFGGGFLYPPNDAEIKRFCNQFS
jgi:serine/threonine protein kinase